MLPRVDYDLIASEYDRRYHVLKFEGVQNTLERFVSDASVQAIAEIGCGTGHWIALFQARHRLVVGVDYSMEMLRTAKQALPAARVTRARAEALPLAGGTVDRLFCVNALHHFRDAEGFLAEVARVLRPGGAVLSIGLDPHSDGNDWWIYTYFPGSLQADRTRYLSTAQLRHHLDAAGFVDVRSEIAQHITRDVPADVAEKSGMLDRRASSQLLVIADAEYERGIQTIRHERPVLHTELRLYATYGKKPPFDSSDVR